MFRRQSVPPPPKRLLQSLQIFVGLNKGSGLQNWPNAVINGVKMRRVGRKFRWCDEVGKTGLAPLLRRFRSVGWSGILLKWPNWRGAQGTTRRPGCHGGKCFGRFLPPYRRKPKGSCRWRKFRLEPSRTSDFGGARRLQTCRKPRWISSCRSDDCGLVRWWTYFHPWT